MTKCEIVDCENTAQYEDPMGNMICETHMNQDVEEGTYEHEEFDQL